MAFTWNADFLLNPRQTDNPKKGDDEIRNLRGASEERAKNEHTTYSGDGTLGSAVKDWLHKAGSAIPFYQASAPATRLSGEALVDGMLWIDSDTGIIYAYDVSDAAFNPLVREVTRFSIQGSLATGDNQVPVIVLPRGGTILRVAAHINTAPTGANILIDLDNYTSADALTGAVFSGVTRLTIVAAAKNGYSDTFHATNKIIAERGYLTLNIDQVGSTIPGADLSVTIEVLVG